MPVKVSDDGFRRGSAGFVASAPGRVRRVEPTMASGEHFGRKAQK